MNLSNLSRPAGACMSVAATVSLALAAAVAHGADAGATNGAPSDESLVLQEITVTATRRAEELSKVPVNITAVHPGADGRPGHRRQIDDIARLTPDRYPVQPYQWRCG